MLRSPHLLLFVAALGLLLGQLPVEASAQVAARVVLPVGESIEEWTDAFGLAGLEMASSGPTVEIVVHSGGWLLRVRAPDGVREAPVAPATSAAGREQIAILAMSLLMPGEPGEPGEPSEPTRSEPPPPRPRLPDRSPPVLEEPDPGLVVRDEPEPRGPVVEEPAEPEEAPAEPEEAPEEAPAEPEEALAEPEEVVARPPEGVRDAAEVERDAEEAERRAAEALRARAAERELARLERRERTERARAEAAEREREYLAEREREREYLAEREREREYLAERERATAREARGGATRAVRAAPFFVASPALLVHRDHGPTLVGSGGGGVRFASGVRVGLSFVGSAPARLTLFEDDGATRRVAALGARGFVAWAPLSPVGPLVGAALGIDARRFGQDGAELAWIAVPVLELTGGLSLAPARGVAIEPWATLRLDLRPIPVDVEGGQESALLPAALLVGVTMVGPPSE